MKLSNILERYHFQKYHISNNLVLLPTNHRCLTTPYKSMYDISALFCTNQNTIVVAKLLSWANQLHRKCPTVIITIKLLESSNQLIKPSENNLHYIDKFP